MRALPPRTLLAALLLTLAACAAHDKAGDKAFAVGDFKTAYVEYRQALADDEKNPQLKARYEESRQKALAQATAQARACAAQGQWVCALNEADFALSIDPASVELGRLRVDASQRVALAKVAQADGEIARGDLQGAQGLLVEARRLSADRAVADAAAGAERRWVNAAMGEADRLRVARRFPEALALTQAAVGYDPSLRPQLDRLGREYEDFRAAEFLRLSQDGERAMAQRAWSEAAGHFKAAQTARPDPRTRDLERYCSLAQQGDQAVSRGDFVAASNAYREAAGLRVDRAGYAEAQLALVAIRPWAVTVRGVLVDAVRPDGTPWVGQPSQRLNQVARELAAGAGRLDGHLLRLVADVPARNRPSLFVEVILPDGRRLASAPADGPYFNLDASFVLAANGFDRRRLKLRVVHQEPGQAPEPVGEVAATVGELVDRASGTLSNPPVLAMELQVAAAEGAAEGDVRGFSLGGEPPRAPPPPPRPGPRPLPPPPKK